MWWRYQKKIAELEQQVADYQRDRLQMLKVMRAMDQALEREQELVKRLSKNLIKRKS